MKPVRPRSRVAIDRTGDEFDSSPGSRDAVWPWRPRPSERSTAEAAADRRATVVAEAQARRSRPRRPPARKSAPPPQRAQPAATAPAPPALTPATRQHAALPPAVGTASRAAPRAVARDVIDLAEPTRTRWSTSSNWSASASLRTPRRFKRRFRDPVARKLAEWIDPAQRQQRRFDRSAIAPSCRPIRAGRRRPSSAGGSKPRFGTTVATTPPCWSWFGNESPISAKGKLLARQAHCSRAATAPMRSAWCARPGAAIRCPRTPNPRRWICSARC